MCTKCFFRRLGAFVAALVLCFALSVPALADEVLSGRGEVYHSLYAKNTEPSSWPSTGFTTESAAVSSGGSVTLRRTAAVSGTSYLGYGWRRVVLPSSLVPSGAEVGIYFSGYYSCKFAANQSKVPTASDFPLRYTDVSTGAYRSVTPTLTLFDPLNGGSSTDSYSDGVSLRWRLSNSVASPISDSAFFNGSTDGNGISWYFKSHKTSSGSDTLYFYFYCTSFRVVSSASNAELDALESMASNIAAQNQILSQFYGDIVAVCNQIYQRLGDLQAAQEEANRLFSNVISLLNTTNGKLEAINMAMSTYFELLINQLKQEGIDTRTAIADAEARLELYLKPMIDYFNELEEQTGESASTLPQHKTDIDGFNNDGFGIEADGQTGLTAILPIFTAFSFILSVLGIFVGLGVLKIIIKKGLS